MPFIRFLKDHTVKAVNGASYKQGDVVECSADSAQHFTSRFVAEMCDPPKAQKPVPKEESEPAPKPKGKQDAKADAPKD